MFGRVHLFDEHPSTGNEQCNPLQVADYVPVHL